MTAYEAAKEMIQHWGSCNMDQVTANLLRAYGEPKNRRERMNLENLAAMIWARMTDALGWYIYIGGPFDWKIIRQWHGELF